MSEKITMKHLEKCFEDAKTQNKKYVGVLISMQGFPNPEIIINTSENFDTKLAYYKKAYNDDLTLKAFNGIKIEDFDYTDSFAKLEDKFFGLE